MYQELNPKGEICMSREKIKEELKEKKWKYREIYKNEKIARKKEGWEDATEDEKKKYGNRKYMGGNMTLVKKEVV